MIENFLTILGKAIEQNISNLWPEMIPFVAFFFGFIVVLVLVIIGLYIYNAFVWMTIAKKLHYKKPWLAWIPIASTFLIPILAKKHWAWGFIFFVPIANIVFLIIWTWDIFKQRNYPGELSLILIGFFIPIILVLAFIAYLVVQGLVAWQDRNLKTKNEKAKKI
ncbi:MAG: hypothetical protein QXP53_00555 [Candidatus Pacearchaeota archaeon]